jgi:hypothetical protein
MVGDRILFDAESKQYATPTAIECHCNSRGDKTPIELFLAGVHSLPADLIFAVKALATIDPAPQDAYTVR